MVVDLKKVTLGQELADGTLWVIEQIPGLVIGADQTTILRAGLFCVHMYIVHFVCRHKLISITLTTL